MASGTKPSAATFTRRTWLKAVAAAGGLASLPPAARAGDFFALKGGNPNALAAHKLFPQGRTLLFSGFSGIVEREKANGFTAFGPVYGDQTAAYQAARAARLPFIYRLGIEMNFLKKGGKPTLVKSQGEIKEEIGRQLSAVVHDQMICWWYLTPEELRYWRADEMAYLKAASEAIHDLDPMRRPVWMYEPNHRTAESLVHTGKYQDIIGKGFYTNYAGYQRARVWVRWSMEQQTEAIGRLGHGTPIIVPEMFRDPEPADFHLIPAWVRHDVYLGLMFGGKAVVVYSLFKRKQLEKSHELYYRAYADVARELTGPKRLGDVFLFGETTSELTCRQVSGPASVLLAKGDSRAERQTSASSELARGERSYPSLSHKTFALGRDRWLFLCNSSEQAIDVEVGGYPQTASLAVDDVFADRPLHLAGSEGTNQKPAFRMALEPLEVKCLKFSAATSSLIER